MILDLFAGLGGWEEGLRLLDASELVVGIEKDRNACATRAAAGHVTIRADVATFPLAPLVGKISGLIASPPCPSFSQAGKGAGRDDLPHLYRFVDTFAREGWVDPREFWPWSDPRTPLVLEPLRYFVALDPVWLAFEQVPDVVELWDSFASVFRSKGYSAWSGVLNAADYGVPQTRRRAFVLASRTRIAEPSPPTHTEGGGSTLLGDLEPWVSMADALGWGAALRPIPTVTGGGVSSGGPEPIACGGREALRVEERGGASLDIEGREGSV